MSSLETEKTDAVSRMEEALSKAAEAETKAAAAVKAEEETRAEMAVSVCGVLCCAVGKCAVLLCRSVKISQCLAACVLTVFCWRAKRKQRGERPYPPWGACGAPSGWLRRVHVGGPHHRLLTLPSPRTLFSTHARVNIQQHFMHDRRSDSAGFIHLLFPCAPLLFPSACRRASVDSICVLFFFKPLCPLQSKTDEVMRLTAQRNNAKSRADSLAKDLSRVCGGGRTLDQIEVIVTK